MNLTTLANALVSFTPRSSVSAWALSFRYANKEEIQKSFGTNITLILDPSKEEST